MSSLPQSILALVQDRQHNRILRLSFPHGDGPRTTLVANRLEAEEGLSRDFEYRVEVLADDASIPLKEIQGKMVTVELVRGDGSLRYFNGYVFEFRLARTDGSVAFYSMLLKPWLAYLRLRKNNLLFHGKTLNEQTQNIFSDYGAHADWDSRVKGNDLPFTMACQFDESDHNYLHRRWEAAGWHYWYEHSEKGHQLVLSDDSTQAEPIAGSSSEIRFQRHAGAQEEDAIGEWTPVRQIVPGRVALSGFNFKAPIPANLDIPTINQQGDVLDVESYEYAGAYGFKDRQDGDAMAKRQMEQIEASGKHVAAAGNSRFAAPGRSFVLTGHFNVGASGQAGGSGKDEFLIVSVVHSASNNYLQQADQAAAYDNRLICIRKSIPWRPARGFNSVDTRIQAPQTATVVGPAGQDVYVDEFARVKLQFHWDRIGANDEKSSAWVRVASPWAGSDLGSISTPRIGSECIVQWLDGNPDHPIVTGAVYNQSNMPPWQLAGQQVLTGMRSREFGNGGNGRSNHLILDDTNAKIQAQLKSDHQHSQLSLGNITRIEDNAGRKDFRGEGWELRTDGHGVARSAKGMLITTEARANAASHIKDMGETVQRLSQATDGHQALAELAEQSGAQEAPAQQTDVAQALTGQNQAIQGGAAEGGDSFPELAAPHLVLASPAGIETTTAQSMHIASTQHTAISSGKSLSIASGDSLFASVAQTFRLFVHKAGMKMIAAAGDIDVKALSNNINLLAKLNISVTAERVTITAKEEVLINGGGSYVKHNAGGIEYGTNGPHLVHAASRSWPGPKSLPVKTQPDICVSCMQEANQQASTLTKRL